MNVLAVSTEDGRVLFYSTIPEENFGASGDRPQPEVPNCRLLGELGGRDTGLNDRIKDFEILTMSNDGEEEKGTLTIVITGSSDGTIRVWRILAPELLRSSKAGGSSTNKENGSMRKGNGEKIDAASRNGSAPRQVGALMGKYETGNRITCLAAFVMNERGDEGDDGDAVVDGLHGAGDGKDATSSEGSDSDSG